VAKILSCSIDGWIFRESLCVLNGAHPLSLRLVEEKRRRCEIWDLKAQCPKVFERFRRPYRPYKLEHGRNRQSSRTLGWLSDRIYIGFLFISADGRKQRRQRRAKTRSVQRPNTWAICITAPSAYLDMGRAMTGLGVASKRSVGQVRQATPWSLGCLRFLFRFVGDWSAGPAPFILLLYSV
jgi:hypothetical protein